MNTFNKENINPLDKNLYLYVPRASLRTTEDQVKDLFFRNQIGNVEYCDLVTIKDKETKQPLYAQLFIKLNCWNMFSNAKTDFERNGSIKIFLTGTEFWMVLSNKNPLPRTHVNTSQLAASTEKLFIQSEAMEKKMDSFEDEMRSEMAEMRAFMKLQQQSIEALKTELAAANDDIEQLSEDNRELRYQLKGCFELVGRGIYGDNTVDENKAAEDENEPDQFDVEVDELLDMPLKTASVADEDGLEIPQVVRCYTIQREINNNNEEDACIFSLNKIPRCLSPIPRLSSRTEPEPLTLVDIVLKNPEKAIASRDFCGNS